MNEIGGLPRQIDWLRFKRAIVSALPTFNAASHHGSLRYNPDTDRLAFGTETAFTDVALEADWDDDIATHEADTTAHGAHGAVVGTTNTQTLTGKTATDLILNNTLEASGNNPSIGGDLAAGTTASAALSYGNDIAGVVTLTPNGTGIAAGTILTVSFATARPDATYAVHVTALNAATAALNFYASNFTTTEFKVGVTSAPSSGVELKWSYLVIEDA